VDGNNTNPGTTYINPGSYGVRLIVFDAAGNSDTAFKADFITVFGLASVDFSADNTSGCFPLTVQFTNLVASGSIASWKWDFGDGTSDTNPNPSHKYEVSGNYNVTLTVTTTDGCQTFVSKQQYIRVADGVSADFFAPIPQACKPPLDLRMTNLSSGPGGITYSWDFGNGTTSTQTNPTARYTDAGDYIITLIARSTDGCSDTAVKNISIPSGSILSAMNAPDSACVRQLVTFTNTSLPDPDSSFWSFGDGTNRTSYDAFKTYTVPGTYQVRLLNKFGTCIDSVIKSIVIVDTPSARFISSIPNGCKPPFTVRFTDQSTGATSWEWRFGDGTTSTERNPEKTYAAFGQYTVQLTVRNSTGCRSVYTLANYVNIAKPTFRLVNLPDSGCVPFTISPQIIVTAVDGVTSYQWDFGDGTIIPGQTPTHTYNQVGNYTIKLRITTNGGCTDSVLVNNIKVGNPGHIADFTATPLSVCAGETVNFTDQSTGTVTGWEWDFGDGGISFDENPTHVYTDTGSFGITLKVYNNGCESEIIKDNYIRVGGAVARWRYTIDCANKNRVTFFDSSINALSWSWDFDDGSPVVTTPSPVHVFPGIGVYDVTLTVVNGACTYKLTQQIKIVDEKADHIVTPDILCIGAEATYAAINSLDANIAKYEWEYGSNAFLAGPRVSKIQLVGIPPGLYDTRLRITDINGCQDSSYKQIRIGGPTANFGALNPTGCKGLTVNFTDSSVSDGINRIVTRVWDFGDGTIQTINNGPVQHTYATAGFFSVKLKVIDSVGCSDSIRLVNYIVTTEPKAAFTTNDTLTCPGKPVQFLNQSPANVNIFAWDFGDGTSSTQRQPAHFFSSPGNYNIKLKIRDRWGCEDSITRTSLVKIDTPFAAFSISDSIANCPPLDVQFTFTGRYGASYRWDFGDGSPSLLANPKHTYTLPGTYNARLILTSPGGCRDTAFRTIKVLGPIGTISYTPTGGCVPLKVDFRASTQNTSSITWDFGDGNVLLNTQDTVLSHIYTDTATRVPIIILKDNKGCPVSIRGRDSIRIIGVTPDFTADTKLLCDKGTVQFNDRSVSNGRITGWAWNFGDGSTSNLKDPTHFYSNPGNYQVTLTTTTEFGCTNTITRPADIRVIKSPDIGITSDKDSVCQNGIITFSGIEIVPDTSTLTWLWNFGNGQSSILKTPPAQQFTGSGTFNVQLVSTNSSGCKDTAIYPVVIHPTPLIDAGPDTTICLGENVRLQASGGATYQWSPASSLSCSNCEDPVALPSTDQQYKVTGQSVFGCVNQDSVTVFVIQPSTVTGPANDSLCSGESVQLIASGTELYTWTPADGLSNPNISNPIARPAVTTTYTVTGTDRKGCFVTTDTVRISVFPYPVVNAGRDTTVAVGYPVTLQGSFSGDVTSLQWSPSTGLSCTNCPNPVALPSNNTTYTLRVVNNGGCVSTDAVTVFVVCTNGNIFIPNTFSPNADGVNDVFYPRARGISQIRSMRIFNRWGQLVFEKQNFNANEVSAGWNGLFRGSPAPSDVYVYTMEVFCENSTIITLKGDVTLVR
jgi:gliding motility-associated-like protein